MSQQPTKFHVFVIHNTDGPEYMQYGMDAYAGFWDINKIVDYVHAQAVPETNFWFVDLVLPNETGELDFWAHWAIEEWSPKQFWHKLLIRKGHENKEELIELSAAFIHALGDCGGEIELEVEIEGPTQDQIDNC